MLSQKLKMSLTPLVWKFFSSSWKIDRFKGDTADIDGPCIFAGLHRDILPILVYLQTAYPYLLVSQSPDGDILVKSLGPKHHRYVRGGTGSEGGKAIVVLRNILNRGNSIGLAVDGPEGPFGTIHDGVLILAKLTGLPILPLKVITEKSWVLNTWDKTVVPFPFADVQIKTGSKFYLTKEAGKTEFAAVRLELAEFFGVTGETDADR